MIKIIFTVLSLVSCATLANKSSPQKDLLEPTAQAEITLTSSQQDLLSRTKNYLKRFPLASTEQKQTDNRGDGDEKIYGTRNFRQVLTGVYYRGGANNKNNKYEERANMNPLPQMGIDNLCKEGFATSIYLYEKNYSSSQKTARCKTNLNNQETELHYLQITAFNEENYDSFFDLIYSTIKNPKAGPIYGHCWNGWHASGLVSALSLMQFCDYSNEKALEYWTKNTDGNDNGYGAVKNSIRNFKPRAAFQITDFEKSVICPK